MSQIIIIIIVIMKRHRENQKGERFSHRIDSGFFSGLVMMFLMSLKPGPRKIFEWKISNACLNQHPRKPNFGNCKRRLGLVRRIRSVPDRSRNRESVAKAGLSPRVILVINIHEMIIISISVDKIRGYKNEILFQKTNK